MYRCAACLAGRQEHWGSHVPVLSSPPEGASQRDPHGLLAALFSQRLDAVVVTDTNLNITEYAGGAEELYGWTRAEALGRHWPALVPTQLMSGGGATPAELLRDEHDVRADARVKRKDGAWIEIQVSATGLRDAAGRLTGWLGIARDLGGVRQAEQRAQEQRDEFAAIFDSSVVGVAVAGPDGRLLRINEALQRMLGYSSDEIRGRFLLEFTHPDDLAIHEAPLRGLFEGQRDEAEFEKRYVHRDGTPVWSLTSVGVLRDHAGAPRLVISTLKNITARKAAEALTAEAERRLREALESLIEGCMLVGRDWTYLFVNDTMAGYCALPRASMVGRRMPEVFPGVEATAAYASYARCMSGGVPQQFENAYTYADGRVGWYEQRVYPVPEGIFVVAIDVTGRKAVEQALMESEAKFRFVVENASDAINLLDLRTGKYVLMNQRQVALTGFTQEEMENLPASEAYDRVHPEDRDISMEQQRRVAAGEDLELAVEYRWRVKSGEYRWFSDSRTLVRDEAGRPVALVGVSQDITERKRVEEAIRQELRTNQTLLEQLRSRKTLTGHLPICMYCKKIHDADGRWHILEEFISSQTDVLFSHGLCPACTERFLQGNA